MRIRPPAKTAWESDLPIISVEAVLDFAKVYRKRNFLEYGHFPAQENDVY
jgi:hypothetical protein